MTKAAMATKLFLAAALSASILLLTPTHARAENLCSYNGYTEEERGVPGDYITQFFTEAGEVFTGTAGESASRMLTKIGSYELLLTLTVVAVTESGFTIRFTFRVVGCNNVVPAVSHTGLAALAMVLLIVAAAQLLRSNRGRRAEPY